MGPGKCRADQEMVRNYLRLTCNCDELRFSEKSRKIFNFRWWRAFKDILRNLCFSFSLKNDTLYIVHI